MKESPQCEGSALKIINDSIKYGDPDSHVREDKE